MKKAGIPIETAYNVLSISSDAIRDTRVVGFIPSISAAPPLPDTLPFASFSAARILLRSRFRRSSSV